MVVGENKQNLKMYHLSSSKSILILEEVSRLTQEVTKLFLHGTPVFVVKPNFNMLRCASSSVTFL